MKPVATRVLLCVALACSLLAVGNAAKSGCCGYGTSGVYASIPSLSYSQYRNSAPSFYGYAAVPYTSSCGACIAASFNIIDPKKSCTFKGSVPAITSYKCKYYLSSVNEFASRKLYPKNLPCSYNSYVSKDVNSTHYESCSTSYLGKATAEFDVTGPSGAARIECKGLVASPSSCYTYTI